MNCVVPFWVEPGWVRAGYEFLHVAVSKGFGCALGSSRNILFSGTASPSLPRASESKLALVFIVPFERLSASGHHPSFQLSMSFSRRKSLEWPGALESGVIREKSGVTA